MNLTEDSDVVGKIDINNVTLEHFEQMTGRSVPEEELSEER